MKSGRKSKSKSRRLYIGVDVGGTKVQASLIAESGTVLSRQRSRTPRDGGSEQVVAVIEKSIEDVLLKENLRAEQVAALGVAVPGVVDPDEGLVVFTPNMSLTGVPLGPHLEDRFKLPVALGNDCNLGALGEKWLGAARKARSVVAVLVGTGIGGGFVHKGRLWRGARELAGEVGHMVMEIDGPQCGCGNRGCFEALASRSAIERDIRSGIAAGRQSVLGELCGGDLSVIRSSAIRKALDRDDQLVTEVVRRASEVLGYGCLTIRHLVDPEVIVLGGGLVEACSGFIMPIVERVVGSDCMPGAREGGRVLLSALGDDAVVIGCVALARRLVGRNPFKKRYAVMPAYPEIAEARFGEIAVGREKYSRDIYISVYGQVKKRDKALAKELYGSGHAVGPRELEKVCRGGPEVLFVGAGMQGQVELTDDARRYLDERNVRCEIMPTPQLVDAYNKSKERKAALIHVTC